MRVWIPGEPVGSTRPRFNLKTGRVYPNPKSAKWVEHCATLTRQKWGIRAPLDRPVVVHFTSVHGRPGRLVPRAMGGQLSKPRRAKLEEVFGDLSSRIPHIVKPDVDNVAKLVLDGLVKAGVVKDDTRVAELVGRKRYCALEEDAPGVEIEVMPWA